MTNPKLQEEISTIFPDNRNAGLLALRKVQLIQLRMLKIVDYICKKNNITYWLDGGTLLGAVRHQGFIPWDDDIDIVMPREDLKKFISIAKNTLPYDLDIEEYDSNISNKSLYIVPCKVIDKFSKILEAHENLHDQGKGIFIDIIPLDNFSSHFPANHIELLLKKIQRALIKISNEKNDGFRLHYFFYKILSFLQPAITPDTPILAYKRLIKHILKTTKPQAQKHSKIIGYGFDTYWTRLFKTSDIFPLQRIKFEDSHFPSPTNTPEILNVFYGEKYMTPPPPEGRKNHHIKKVIIDSRENMSEVDVSYQDNQL